MLVFIPSLTDLVETDTFPSSLRGWTTELVLAALIAILVQKLRKDHVEALALARTDALTGLGNRRAFNAAIEREWARARRSGQPLSLIFIDLNDFKEVNDRFGHDAGDAALERVAQAINKAVRAKVDSGFRLGGDEFAVLLAASDACEAAAVVVRIRARCASPLILKNHRIGFSAGIVELAAGEPLNEFLLRADADMYRQKQSSKSARF